MKQKSSIILSVIASIALLSAIAIAQSVSLPKRWVQGEQLLSGDVDVNFSWLADINSMPAAQRESIGALWAIASDTTEKSITAITSLGGGVSVAGSADNGIIYRTVNYGTTWAVASTTAGKTVPALCYLDNGVVVGATAKGTSGQASIIRSTNYGAAWSTAITLTASHTSVLSLTYCGRGIVLAGTSKGTGPASDSAILKSEDYGATWAAVSSAEGLDDEVKSLAYCGRKRVLAGTYPNGKLLESKDYGDTWTVKGTLGYDVAAIAHCHGDVVLAAVNGPNGGEILRSINMGTTWQIVNSVTRGVESVAYLGHGAAVAGDYADGIIMVSHDDGKSWMIGSDTVSDSIMSVTGIDNGVVLAGASGTGIIYRSVIATGSL